MAARETVLKALLASTLSTARQARPADPSMSASGASISVR